MPRHTPIQNSFNGGEFSPRMFGRTDLDKYRASARLIQNFSIIPQGGLVRRSGSRYVANAADDDFESRLQAFVFSDVQAYMLEWGNRKLRIFVNEGLLLQQTLSGIEAQLEVSTATGEFTVIGHGYLLDEGPVRVSSTDTVPPPLSAVADYWMKPATTVTVDSGDIDPATEFFTQAAHDLTDQMGPYHLETVAGLGVLPNGLDYNTDYYIHTATVNTFGLSLNPTGSLETFTTNGSGTILLVPTVEYRTSKFRLAVGSGQPAVVLTGPGVGVHTITPTNPLPIEITTPYASGELADLQFAQSADVLYIAHRNHPPRTLSRFSLQSFSLDIIDFTDGPYFDENPDDAHTLNPAAVTGKNILLTSSVAIFKGTDVGRPVRILHTNGTDVGWGWATIVAVNPNSFADADVIQTTISGTTLGPPSFVTTPTHSLQTGDLVALKAEPGGVLPVPLTAGTPYWIRRLGSTTMSFYTSKTDSQTDTARIVLTVGATAVVHITSSVLNIVAHGFNGGEGPLSLVNDGGALPIGFSEGTEYFVGFVDVDNITLSESVGGDPVRIDDAYTGGGIHTMQGSNAPLTTCQIDIERDFINTGAVASWRLGAWSGDALVGFPRAVTFHEQRLWWAGSVGEPQKLWSSRTAKFIHMAPTGTEGEDLGGSQTGFSSTPFSTNGVTHEIGATRVNVIQWMVGGRNLLLGATNAAWQAGAALISEAITPTNFQVRQAGSHGSAPIVPAVVDDRVIYISDTRQKTFSLGYSFESDNYLAEDLMLLAEHIGLSGLRALDFAHEPNSTVWFVKGDGELVALTLLRDQKISGWTRHVMGGNGVVVESVGVIPSPIGDASQVGRANRNHDQVWLAVRRTVGGVSERWIEFLEDVFETDDVLEDAFFVDGGSTYNGSATLTPGPFNHLKGETVDVLADGRQHLGLVVDATTGLITLPETAALVHAGYQMISQIRSLRLAVDGPEGTAQGNLGRIDHLVLRLDLSLGGKYGPDENDLTELGRELIPFDQDMDLVAPPFTGDIEVDFDGGWDAYGEIFIQQDEPLPFSLLAVLARVQKSARGDRARGGP